MARWLEVVGKIDDVLQRFFIVQILVCIVFLSSDTSRDIQSEW